MSYGDAVTVVRDLGNVLPDVVVQPQASILREERNRVRGELLRDRGDVKDRSRGDGDRVLEVRHAVSVQVHRLAILRDAERASG